MPKKREINPQIGWRYILDGHDPVPEKDLYAWGKWMETADRHVADDRFGNIRVSTIFLGLDHDLWGTHPLLFETIIFEDRETKWLTRCSTWEEAEEMHAAALKEIGKLT